MMACVIGFPLLHMIWRKRPRPRDGAPTEFAKIDAIKLAWAGAGVPQAFCMLIWPIWPGALDFITEAPWLLLPTGFATLTLATGDLFDWK